ncbi:MAG: hypothetical protein Q8L98_00675 [Chlamydiales bacterium]|nr:hypothetical protein [Chlamydiales bacterium]
MHIEIEYPVRTLFSLLIWAAQNWHTRLESEWVHWEERVGRFLRELIAYLKQEESSGSTPR